MSLNIEDYGKFISGINYIYSTENKLVESMLYNGKDTNFTIDLDYENKYYKMRSIENINGKTEVKEKKKFMIMEDLFNHPLDFFTKTISAPKIKIDKKIDISMGNYKFEIKPETESCIVQDTKDDTIYIYGVQGTTCEPDYTNLKETHYILTDPKMIYSQHRYMYTQDYLYIPDKLTAIYDDFDLSDKFGIIFLKYKPCLFNSDNKYRLKYDKYGILSFMGKYTTVARYESYIEQVRGIEKDKYIVSIHPLIYDPFDIKNNYNALVEEGYFVMEYLGFNYIDSDIPKSVEYTRNIYKCDKYKELLKDLTDKNYEDKLIIDVL